MTAIHYLLTHLSQHLPIPSSSSKHLYYLNSQTLHNSSYPILSHNSSIVPINLTNKSHLLPLVTANLEHFLPKANPIPMSESEGLISYPIKMHDERAAVAAAAAY